MVSFERAVAAHRAGDLETAERGYIALAAHRNALHNLGALYSSTGRNNEAETVFRKLLAAHPTYAPSRQSLGMLYLSAGDYERGWPLYEARREVPGSVSRAPPVDYPEWRGEDLRGRRMLVYGEQGFGDQIMFARYIPELAARGCVVTFACSPCLVRLFANLPAEIVAGDGSALPGADYWTLLSSLPFRLGPSDIPPPQTVGPAWTGGVGVGVVARGSSAHANDQNRSLPAPQAADLEALGQGLAPEVTGAQDFADTAEIIAGLEMVVTVDTSVAHLAGSMGKPVWILLPAVAPDWRWQRERDDSPWYPTARLFRQPEPGDWRGVLRQVREALSRSA